MVEVIRRDYENTEMMMVVQYSGGSDRERGDDGGDGGDGGRTVVEAIIHVMREVLITIMT